MKLDTHIAAKVCELAGVDSPKVTEAAFTADVIGLARACGWFAVHFRPGRTKAGHWRTACQGDAAGWPDLFLLRMDGRKPAIIVIELKVGKNRPTMAQRDWIERFKAVGVPAYVFTERDWDAIVGVLGA